MSTVQSSYSEWYSKVSLAKGTGAVQDYFWVLINLC